MSRITTCAALQLCPSLLLSVGGKAEEGNPRGIGHFSPLSLIKSEGLQYIADLYYSAL